MGILVIIAIALPLLTFAAIPNILFGFGSSTKTEVVEFTSLASLLDVEYDSVDSYEETEADSIVEKIIELLRSLGDSYDDMEVTRDLDNMSEEWFIAISSVAHEQNLFTMGSGTIEDMTALKMDSRWELLPSTVGEGGKLLKIDVFDITPEELMDKLNFTDEQKNWAAVLYSTMVQEQLVTRADGDSYYGTDYGDVVFTDAAVDVVYYNQTDSRWGGELYGTKTIAATGCGPTALAMAIATFIDSSITPLDVAKWGKSYYVQDKGSDHALIPEAGEHFGLTVTGLGANAQKVVDALGRGNLVIAIMAKGHFTGSGHFILLRGMTADGNILVADPSSITRSNQEWSLKLILNEVNRYAKAGGPCWEVGP